MIQILVHKLTGIDLMRRACDMTRKEGMKPSEMTLDKIYRCEHSPVRTQQFWIELRGIFTFVSVHLVRHKHGVEHFVESNRDDRGGNKTVDRYTPVNHGMFINAQALINMSLKRLCFNSHPDTVRVWSKLRRAIRRQDPDLANYMVPACVYRNGFCPELRECKPGLEAVMRAYTREKQ